MGSLSEKIVANSEAMQKVQHELEPLVDAAAPLLFWGETKSGMGHYGLQSFPKPR